MTKFVIDNGKNLFESYDKGEIDLTFATKEKINNINGELQYSIIEGHYVSHSTGEEGEVSSYICTGYIEIPAGMGINIKTVVANDASGLCFYDEHKNYISGYNPFSDNNELVEIDIPENTKFVRVSCLTVERSKLYIEYSNTIYSLINILNQKTDQTFLDSNVIGNSDDSITFIQNKYVVHTTGAVNDISNTKFYISSNVDVRLKSVIYLKTAFVDLAGAAFYDENNGFISGVGYAEGYNGRPYNYIINVPNGAAFFRFTIYTNYMTLQNVVLKTYTTIETLRNELISQITEKTDFWSFSLWRVLCIGDSLTSGANYAPDWSPEGSSIDENYPRILGRMINGDVTNAGVSGASASDWYVSESSKYDFSNYDTFIIWLGTNNGLTDTLATDVDPYEDYNDFAETETGYYCKIIGKIKEQNPDCLIVLTKIFASKGNVETTNSVIEQIANKYSLPIIDNSDLTVARFPVLHGNVNNPHFTKAGNIYIAKRYIKNLGSWFAENPNRTEYGYTPRTN